MKILISAWACNPRQGSEAGVGWAWLAAIKAEHEVHVLTARYQREWIEEEIGKEPDHFARVRFHYTEPRRWKFDDTSRFWRWQARIPALVPVFHAYYRRWLRAAYQTALRLSREIQFDLVHQLTLVGFRFPGHLWKLGLPFVWGPIGGLENLRWCFLPELGLGGALHYAGRNAVNSVHRVLLRAPRKAFVAAGPGAIAATERIQKEIKRWYGVDSQVICEIGIPSDSIAASYPRRTPGAPLRLAWSGRHASGKALPLLLRALAALPGQVEWRLDILGDGPCRGSWYSLASKLGLQDRCAWHGWLPRAQAVARLAKAHLLVVTSLQDLTSSVLVEALANGVPVICPDHCGFSDAITPESGIKLPVTSLRQFREALTFAIHDLYDHEEGRRCLARGALRRAMAFSPEVKGLTINFVYKQVLTTHLRNPLRTVTGFGEHANVPS